MPAAYVAQLAKEKGVSTAKAEERWEAAKKSAEDQGRGDDYAYVTGIFKKMMGESEVEQLIGRVLEGESPDKVWERTLVENRRSELAKKMGLEDDDIANEDYYSFRGSPSGIAKMHAVTIVKSNSEARKKLEKAGYELAKKQPSDSRTYATFEKKIA